MSDKIRFVPLETENVQPRVQQQPSMAYRIMEIGALSLSTLVLVATFVINGLASSSDHQKFGFKYTMINVSDMFNTQITPVGYTFAIWGIIYPLQIAWLIYGWTFVCRTSVPKTICPITYISYAVVNLTTIAWTYAFDNLHVNIAAVMVSLTAISLYITIGSAAYYLYKQTPTLQKQDPHDLYVSRILVLNSLAIYATWTTFAVLIGFTTFLQYFTSLGPVGAGTTSLSILGVLLCGYFILENTILDRFLRYVGLVYPVVIWILSGVMVAHWGKETDEQNPIITVVWLAVAIVLFLVRIVLWVVFAKIRPLPGIKKTVV